MFALQCGLITASSFVQNSIIASQQFNSVAEKSLIVADNVISLCVSGGLKKTDFPINS